MILNGPRGRGPGRAAKEKGKAPTPRFFCSRLPDVDVRGKFPENLAFFQLSLRVEKAHVAGFAANPKFLGACFEIELPFFFG